MSKSEFTEGIFWRPTVSLPNSTVRTKRGRKRPAKQLAQSNPAKANSKAITTQADVAVSPKAPSPNKSRSGRVIKPGKNLKQL